MMKMLKETQRRTKQPNLSSLLKNNTDVNLMTRTTTHGQARHINHSVIVASYFYYYKDEYRHVQMLQSLLFQILKQQEGMFSVYYNTYIELTSEGAAKSFSCVDPVEPLSTWSFTHLQEIFKALLNFQEYPIRIELFVDAVDESQETSEVIRILRNLASQATRTSKVIIKAVVTSRPMDDLPYRENEHRIAVEEHNAEDIERVIETGITRISNKIGTFNEKVKALYDLPLLRNELIKCADGVILWISTVFKLIEYKLGTNQLAPAGLGNGNGTLMSKWTGKEYDIFASYLEERPLIFYIFENLPAHMKSLDSGLYKEKARELLSSVKEIYKSNYPGEPILSLWMLQEFPRDKIAARRLLNRTMEGLLNTLTPTNDLQQNRDFLTSLLDAAVRNNYKIAVRILCAAGILAADDDHNAYSMAVETAAKGAHWDMIEHLDQVKWHNHRAEPATGTALDGP